MNKSFLFLILIFEFSGLTAQDNLYDVSKIPPELLENANAVMRSYSAVFEIDDIDNASLRVHYAITILNKSALKHSYFVKFYNKFIKIKSIEANVYDKNGDPELHFSTSRSSGPGGQHVNKVNTKVELRFSIPVSELLTQEEKIILFQKLKNKINKDGELIIVSQENRSQLKNKEAAIEKFLNILKEALTPVKERKSTKPTRTSNKRRLIGKKLTSEKKTQRKKPDID